MRSVQTHGLPVGMVGLLALLTLGQKETGWIGGFAAAGSTVTEAHSRAQ
jgi:hypothetical protein